LIFNIALIKYFDQRAGRMRSGSDVCGLCQAKQGGRIAGKIVRFVLSVLGLMEKGLQLDYKNKLY
jgi:hypothetical protein